jgi:hypothetical protein
MSGRTASDNRKPAPTIDKGEEFPKVDKKDDNARSAFVCFGKDVYDKNPSHHYASCLPDEPSQRKVLDASSITTEW